MLEGDILWCGTNRGGIYQFNIRTKKYSLYYQFKEAMSIYSILRASNGDLWLGAASPDVGLIKLGKDKSVQNSFKLANDTLPPQRVRSVRCMMELRWTHIILWIIFSTFSGVVLFLLPSGIMQKISLFALAVWLIAFGVVLARRVIVAYRRAIRIFNETQADDIGAYIEWLSIFTYWAVIFGVGCGLLTFLPDRYVYIWVLSSIPFYCYLFHCYQNYLLFYEQVENAFEQDIQSEEELLTNSGIEPEMVSEEVPESYTEFIEKVDNWIKTDGYVQQGLTIKELSKILYTNRTYLSAYIKTTYKMTFREWITSLRLEYAKNILKEHPEINIQKLAESSGFLSRSNFIKLFSEKEGCTPAKWKKSNRE